ncbi:MAG: AraC family transcriptional regulator [Planctomycetota bacterium]|nr:AraC family transcriptional regulator [Planctomycetota bacterium]
MRRPVPLHAPSQAFWQVRGFQFHQQVAPESGWAFENAHRQTAGVVIFQFVARGRMYYRDRRGAHEVLPGGAALFALGEESYYGVRPEFGEPLTTHHMSLHGAGLLDHVNQLRARFGSVYRLGEDNPVLEAMRPLTDQSRPRSAADASLHAAALYAWLMRLYAYLEEQWSREKPPVERAVEELLRHPLQPWSLKAVSARHGVSREHLTRVFAARTGKGPAAWLAGAKLQKALELLRDTGLPVAAVAEQSGFTSKHTLARRVRKATGRSPGGYRKSSR